MLAPADAPARDRGLTVIHPSAASEARRWPIERWTAVARVERAMGHRVAITGSREDFERAAEIAERAGLARTQVYAGSTDLRELAALVATAGRVVCGDTGVAHLATALRTPCGVTVWTDVARALGAAPRAPVSSCAADGPARRPSRIGNRPRPAGDFGRCRARRTGDAR